MADKREQGRLSDFVVMDADSAGSLSADLQQLLGAIRAHLGMEVAFVSEFRDGQRVFRVVDSSLEHPPVRPGGANPLEESYCQSVVDGRLPELIADTGAVPETRRFAVTAALPVGAHMSVPIRLKDGRVYGTFCCFSRSADASLGERDLKLMRVFADLAAHRIDHDLARGRQRQDIEQRIDSALAGDGIAIVYQPIFDLKRAALCGFESLSRFSASPLRSPDKWFGEAASIGRGVELELMVLEKAMRGMVAVPTDVYLSFNLSPAGVMSERLEEIFEHAPLERVVLEVTEHADIPSYEKFAGAVSRYRDRGLRLAVDDAGAGYASFRHILNLKPDMIKLDMTLTRDVDSDPARRALATALIAFANETGSDIVAEGVESASELRTLRVLGAAKAQGYYLGRPVALETALACCRPGQSLKSGFSG